MLRHSTKHQKPVPPSRTTRWPKLRDGFAATGWPTVADDSGLEVAALNRMPGVLSARWSGRHGEDAGNTALLLAQVRDVPDERRNAAFVSACALVSGSGAVVVRGEWPGVIAREPRGDAGFGYDPGFIPNGEDRTAAQLTSVEKDRDVASRSRAQAVAASVASTCVDSLLDGADIASISRGITPKTFRLQGKPSLDVLGLEMLDDDAQQRDGPRQQHADRLGNRPADLDGKG